MTLGIFDRLRPRRDAGGPVVIEGLSQTRAYWEGLRGTSALPQRRQIDPRGLAGVLDRVFLADRIGKGLAQIRIAGSALGDFAGTDVRGLPLSCLFGAESRGLLSDTLEQVFNEPALCELDLASDRVAGGGIVARLLLLPVEDETHGRLVLGMLGFAEPRPARCKLQILARREEKLMLPPKPAPEIVPEAPSVVPIRRMRHLALVHSSK